ncbi:MAG: DNA-3-methyladenine glycosylase I [SAR202 cluster bacterium]|nr:DNA-3-methyladenine glycosylase I [SAR202 cluster bacterium]
MTVADNLPRCWDLPPSDPMKLQYHDYEWGTPTRDDARLFEFLSLSGVQAGLSWWGVWVRREAFRKHFDGFDPARVAKFDDKKLAKMLADAALIRNKAKLNAIINNARAIANLRPDFDSLSDYLWSFVDGKPVVNKWKQNALIPAVTPLAERMSKDMISRGFKFVGPTIMYAYIQSVGLVNDHYVGCFRHADLPFDAVHPKLLKAAKGASR